MNRLVYLVVFAAAVAAVAGTLVGRMNRKLPPPPDRATVPVLRIPADKLTFGETWETDRFEWTLPVENRGPSTVAVSRITASCSCLAVTPQEFSIDPGQSREVKLVIDLRDNGTRTATRTEFGVSVEFTLSYDPGHTPLEKVERFQVTGRVRKALAVPAEFYLGTHSELIEKIPSATFEVDALTKLKSLTATSTRPDIRVEKRPSEAPGTRYTFVVALTSRPAKGPVEGTILLDAVTEDGRKLPMVGVRVLGAIIDDIQAEPLAIQVGGRRLGETFEEVVTIRSLTGQVLTNFKADCEGEGLVAEVAGGASGHVRVRQSVCDVGMQSTRVRIVAESKGRQTTIYLPVSYTGIGKN